MAAPSREGKSRRRHWTPHWAWAVAAPSLLLLTGQAALAQPQTEDVEATAGRRSPSWKTRPLVSAEMLWDTADLMQSLYTIFLSDIVFLFWAIAWRLAYPAVAILRRFVALFCFLLGSSEEDLRHFLADAAHQTVAAIQVFGVYADRKLIPLTNWAVDWIEESFPRQVGVVQRTPADLLVFLLYLAFLTWGVVQLAFTMWDAARQFGRSLLACCPSRSIRTKPPLLYRQEVPYVQPPWLDPSAVQRPAEREAIGDDGAKLQRPRPKDDLMLCCLFPNLFG